MSVHNCLFATMTSVGAYVVLWSLASAHAILVAVFALTIVVILGRWTLGYAEWSVAHVFAFDALIGIRTRARTVALFVTHLASLIVRLINSTQHDHEERLTSRHWSEKIVSKMERKCRNIKMLKMQKNDHRKLRKKQRNENDK